MIKSEYARVVQCVSAIRALAHVTGSKYGSAAVPAFGDSFNRKRKLGVAASRSGYG